MTPRSRRSWTSLLPWALLVLLAAGYVTGYALTGDGVPRGTTVEGVDIGGLDDAAAERTLRESLGRRVEQPLRVTAEEERLRVDPADAGISLDVAASVSQAGGGRTWNPVRMWRQLFGGEPYDAVVDVDRAQLGSALEPLTSAVDRAPKDGRITFRPNGEPRARSPRPGREIDREQAATVLEQAVLGDDRTVELPVSQVAPEITEEEVRAAMDEFARPAVSAPVTLRVDGEEVELAPRSYARALSVEPVDGALEPVLDEKVLLRRIQPALEPVTRRPRDATVRLADGRPEVVPARPGVTVDEQQLTDEFLSVVTAQGESRVLELDTQRARPDFTTAEARELGIKEVVSSFTTSYPHAEYRNVNIGRAAELVNGTVLKPGETFSLNETVGERTVENGFTEGYIIADGILKQDLGGGVSQAATTLFNAAFFAGLEDVEHKPHSFYIDRYPIGREATVVWGAVDLRFKNDTPYGVLIESWIEPSSPGGQGSMHARMWSTKHWDIEAQTSERYNFTSPDTRYLDDPECEPHQGYGGFDIDVTRIFRKPGSDEVVRRETMHTTYTPSDTVVCQ